ncbi:hypothetical protein [Rhizobium sp. L43]|uniref:lipopolysaccharide biosynthesis protein n=1 Tax=Rhizobium sp. L43 TaxID=2035452 RepID=UPI000BEABB0D|nr:hypothetical protein [Rhizobium sp. L43]PDS76366.1 hypothetical protein CO667_22455 [Rhizobium sp. L43]
MRFVPNYVISIHKSINSIATTGRDTVAITAAAVLAALTQWLVIVAIARIEGPTELGYFSFAQAIVIPVSYLAWLSSRQQILAAADFTAIDRHVLLRLVVPLALFSFAFVVVVFGLGRFELVPYLLAAIIMKYAEGIFDIWSAILQVQAKSMKMLRLTIVRVVPANILLVATYAVTSNIVLGSIISFLAMASASFFFERADIAVALSVMRQRWPGLGVSQLVSLIRLSFPLALANLLMSVAPAGLRLVVEHKFDASTLGYFSAINQFVTLGSLVQTAFGQAILPRLAYQARQRAWAQFWRTQLGGIGFMLCVGVVATGASYAIGSQVLLMIYGERYVEYYSFLIAMAAAAGFQYAGATAGVGAFAMHLRKTMLLSYCVVSVVTLSAAYFLASSSGVFCIPIALAVGGLCQIGVFTFAFWRIQYSQRGI